MSSVQVHVTMQCAQNYFWISQTFHGDTTLDRSLVPGVSGAPSPLVWLGSSLAFVFYLGFWVFYIPILVSLEGMIQAVVSH